MKAEGGRWKAKTHVVAGWIGRRLAIHGHTGANGSKHEQQVCFWRILGVDGVFIHSYLTVNLQRD